MSYWETEPSPAPATYADSPPGVIASAAGSTPVPTSPAGFAVSRPPAPTSYWETVSTRSFVTYADAPSGLSVTELGPSSAGTVGCDFGERPPPVNTLNWYTSAVFAAWVPWFVTYTEFPSGLIASPLGVGTEVIGAAFLGDRPPP